VNRASEKYRGNTEYWKQFDAVIQDRDAMKSVFQYFKTREITSDFRNPEATPLTAYHKALVRENTPSVDLWLESVTRQYWYEEHSGNPVLTWDAETTTKKYLSWCDQTGNKPETEAPNKLSRILTMRDYGISGATKTSLGAKGKAMRTIYIDKCLEYFKKAGVITEDQFYIGTATTAEEDTEKEREIAEAIEKKMKAQQEKALIQKLKKEVGKKMSGEAKQKMFAMMEKATKKLSLCEDPEPEPEQLHSRFSSKVPTRAASPESSEDDMDDLE
jgi:hypothetical protein